MKTQSVTQSSTLTQTTWVLHLFRPKFEYWCVKLPYKTKRTVWNKSYADTDDEKSDYDWAEESNISVETIFYELSNEQVYFQRESTSRMNLVESISDTISVSMEPIRKVYEVLKQKFQFWLFITETKKNRSIIQSVVCSSIGSLNRW